MIVEHFFSCPYCWVRISMMLDLSAGGQSYVEDCENCCNPIDVVYEAEGGELVSFNAEPTQA